jgi:hypothetical protein
MIPNEVRDVLASIAQLGRLPFEAGDGGSFAITLADGDELGLEIDPEGNTLVLSAPLFALANHDREALFATAMRLNHLGLGTSGGTLGWNEQTDELVLSAVLPLALLDEVGFLAALEAFADQVMRFRASGLEPAGSAPTDRLDSTDPSDRNDHAPSGDQVDSTASVPAMDETMAAMLHRA